MNGLEFLYTVFGFIIYSLIGIYYFSGISENQTSDFKESKIWILGGIPFLITLTIMSAVENYSLYVFYAFLALSSFLYVMLLRYSLKNQTLIHKNVAFLIEGFVIIWLLYSLLMKNSFYITILPVILIQVLVLFFIGLFYLLHDEYEMSMRNISGMLFLVLTILKISYLFEVGISATEYVRGVFNVDFIIYLFIGFVIVLFDYNRKELIVESDGRQINDSIGSAKLGTLQMNIRGDIISANDMILKKLERSGMDYENEAINVTQLIRFPKDESFEQIKDHLNNGHTYSIESVDTFMDDEKRYEFVFLPNRSEEQGNAHSMIIHCLVLDGNRELSVVSKLEEETENNYSVPNRYRLMELFEIGIHHKRMYHFGIILVKIVNYDTLTKIVNDHEYSAIDYIITEKIKKLDFIYCIGKVTQDTYEIITHDYNENSEIVDFIQLIKDILMHQSFYDHEMNIYSLDYRIGVALAPEDGFTQRDLLRKASIAIAKAATEEQGYVQFYHDEIKHEVANKLHIATRLRDSLFTDQLFMLYQPQYCMASESIKGFEALVRWMLPDGTVMSPNEFIPIAEENDLMDELGEWIFRNSFEQGAIWNNKYHMDWTLSVNVSVCQMEYEGFAQSVLNLLSEYELDPYCLELEVTETKIAKSSDRVLIELRKLQEKGVKIAIDDFGTGYSSLDFLRHMPFDIIKIDKGFIERLNQNEIDHKIVESIINLVKNIEVHSVAEGVETEEQLRLLKHANVDYVQGYVYSRPMRADKVIEKIKEILKSEGVLFDEEEDEVIDDENYSTFY